MHNSFDNLTFADSTQLLAAEDRGNTLHSELNTLDSIWTYPVGGTISTLRFVSLGRDTTSETEGEDNEPTGVYVSSGGTHIYDLLGTPAGWSMLAGSLPCSMATTNCTRSCRSSSLEQMARPRTWGRAFLFAT